MQERTVCGVRTSKPVATISYNSAGYLELKLEELRRAGRISEWYFIQHKAEEDEKKDHIHLYVVPSKMLQTDDLVTYFMEPDPASPTKPLTCPRWVSSKFGDWYLYSIHDPAYLASKGQTRKYHYCRDDVKAYDRDALDESIHDIDLTLLTVIQRMQEAQAVGLTFGDYLKLGRVPIAAVRAYEHAWQLLKAASTYRAGRQGHDTDTVPDGVDPHTGVWTAGQGDPQKEYSWEQMKDDDEIPF